ncbi:hypothetical protein M595_5389 [Lyngbya aestuarii BL J]|uniref:Uncharacterized protein n=1 Tax=Lyngbya aestuarii BL J TaxID=1348334 RepID=U7QBV6_9CYAN|nr:hypothetical protein M595_5389 [Lyngbya aestuarii BL J]
MILLCLWAQATGRKQRGANRSAPTGLLIAGDCLNNTCLLKNLLGGKCYSF